MAVDLNRTTVARVKIGSPTLYRDDRQTKLHPGDVIDYELFDLAMRRHENPTTPTSRPVKKLVRTESERIPKKASTGGSKLGLKIVILIFEIKRIIFLRQRRFADASASLNPFNE